MDKTPDPITALLSFLIITCVIVGDAATGIPPSDALLNGGFERGLTGWQHAREGRVVEDASLAHSGKYAARLRFDDSLWQSIPCTPGSSYEVSGYVRREKAGGIEVPKLKIGFRSAGDKAMGAMAHQVFDVTTGYRRFSFSITPPHGTATIGISLVGQFQGSEWFDFDDIQVTSHFLRDMPLWENTPDLNHKTVAPIPILDVRSFALYLWEASASDGLIASSCSTRRADYVRRPPATCNFDVTLSEGLPPNYLLVHSLSIKDRVRRASLFAATSDRWASANPLVEVRDNTDCVLSRQFRESPGSRFRLQVVNPNGEESAIHEIQFLNLRATQQDASLQKLTPLSVPATPPGDYPPHIRNCFASEADRRVIVVDASGSREMLDISGGNYINLLGEPCREETGITRIRLRLKVSSPTTENVLEVCVRQPQLVDINPYSSSYKDRGLDPTQVRDPKYSQPFQYADLCRVYTRLGAAGTPAVLDTVLDVPDAVLLPGERVWITLRPLASAKLELQESGMAVVTTSPGEVEREFFPRLLRVTRSLYTFSTSAHVYGNPDSLFNQHLQRALRIAPDNPVVDAMVRRITGRKAAVALKSAGPPGAPEWAVWQREALRNYHSIVRWWIENRQVENGEFGGDINDDGELTCQWPFLYLITGDPAVREALRKLSDAAWERNLSIGYSVGMDDVEHAAEEILCSQPQMLLMDYGNPEYIERLMLTSSYIPQWTGVNEKGERLFRSFRYKAGYVNTEPKHDVDNVYNALVMAAPYYLSWYAANAQPCGWFLEWARTWARKSAAAQGDKPAGAIPCDLQFFTGKISPYTKSWRESTYWEGSAGSYCTRQALLAAYLVSREKEMLLPFEYEPNASGSEGMGVYWRRLSGDTRHDALMVKKADELIAGHNEPVLPLPSGAEVKVALDASKAIEVSPPMKLDTFKGAPVDPILYLPREAPPKSGSAVLEVTVNQAGLYAVCVLGFAETAGSSACTAKIGDLPTAMVSVPAVGKWMWAVSNRPMELKPGKHRITVYGRHPGFRIAQVGLTTNYSIEGNWSPLGFPATDGTMAYSYIATGNRKYLVEQLKEINRESVRQRWLLTEADPATDRVPIPGARLLSFMYLGGNAGGPKAGYPHLAVSYENAGDDLAALVLDNQPTRCKVLLYNFDVKPREVTVRFWELAHGEYSLSLGPDTDGNDQADSITYRESKSLQRYDGVKVTLPPRQLQVLEATQTKPLEPITTRPDLALSARDVKVSPDGRTVNVTVHNIGAAAVPSAMVRVVMNGRPLAVGSIRNLPAPAEVRPATQVVVLRLNTPLGSKGFMIDLDADDAVQEITEVNNRVTVRGL